MDRANKQGIETTQQNCKFSHSASLALDYASTVLSNTESYFKLQFNTSKTFDQKFLHDLLMNEFIEDRFGFFTVLKVGLF
jgi:hypothetical protein